MRKFISLLFLLLGLSSQMLHAQSKSEKIEVLAKHLESTKNTVSAKEGVVVYYKDSVMKANEALYDRNKHLLVLSGDVETIGYDGSKQKSQQLKINTQNDRISFEKLFLVNKNDVWLVTEHAEKREGNYTLGSSIISSCDISDPLWRIRFERSHYDSETKYMKVYDAKVYFRDTPIFYSPFLAFNTNKERSTGFLFPVFGYSNDEGMIYEQPFFWNISPSMDMEFNPQIRTDRSLGMYTTFRFVDSAVSSGQIRTGYFKDTVEYQQRENNVDREHYGFEFYYDAAQLFSRTMSPEIKDGLYIHTTLLNDIDYINLQETKLTQFGRNPLQESKLNYFIHNEDYYAGINTKYFIDTRKEDNDDTLQSLPSLQLHKYLDSIFLDDLIYSIDAHLNHLYRKTGVTFKQAEVNIPLEYSYAFFDDYLTMTAGEEFYYSKFFFGNGSYEVDQFRYYSNIHKVKLFSDLTKKYDHYVHVLQPEIEYIKPGDERHYPVSFDQLSDDQKELFTVGLPEEHYAVGISQYFYDETMHLKFFQRLSQRYYPNREYRFADLSNEMQYNWRSWQFYNDMLYSYEFKKIRESSSRISLDTKSYGFTLGHSYKEKLPDDQTVYIPANDVSFSFRYQMNPKIKVEGSVTYDVEEVSSTQWRVGGSYTLDCWSMDLAVSEDTIPLPSGFRDQTRLYLQFNFIPFGSIGTGG